MEPSWKELFNKFIIETWKDGISKVIFFSVFSIFHAVQPNIGVFSFCTVNVKDFVGPTLSFFVQKSSRIYTYLHEIDNDLWF